MTTPGAVEFTGTSTWSVVPESTAVNAGNAATSHRWTLTLTATATTVVFRNRTEAEQPLTIVGLVAGNAVVVDGTARTVSINGVVVPGAVAAGSGWPALLPGGNDLHVSGATGTFQFRPTYL